MDERFFESLLAHTLHVIPELAPQLDICAADERFSYWLGGRGYPDVTGWDADVSYRVGIEVKLRSQHNRQKSGRWQLDVCADWALQQNTSTRLFLLIPEAKKELWQRRFRDQGIESSSQWKVITLTELLEALDKVIPAAPAERDEAAADLVLALARLTDPVPHKQMKSEDAVQAPARTP